MKSVSLILCVTVIAGSTAAADDPRPFAVRVVDSETGRGVPLIELETTDHIRRYTDSAGYVAFDEPGSMDRLVFFHVRGHGYEYPRDGFGYRGKALLTKPGAEEVLVVERRNIARRLYRVTGSGIYAESLRLGKPVPIGEPLLNAQVTGSDSVVTIIAGDRLLWFWGDTNRPGYPLGNFHVPHAVSTLPGAGGLDPGLGVDLLYEVDAQGFAKSSARMPGEGPTWIFGLASLPSKAEKADRKILASYVKVRPPMEIYRRGACAYDPESRSFQPKTVFPIEASVHPDGHPFHVVVAGTEYLYFANGYPFIRVPATVEDYLDLGRYEAFTPLRSGSKAEALDVERDEDGRAVWGWKRNAPALTPKAQQRLVRSGRLAAEDALLALRDVETGKPILGHNGSVYWNEFTRSWLMIISEEFGTSMLGEVWLAEAESPLGPWVYARKIVSHDAYSFYNPKQHPYFSSEGGRIVRFEGTYTMSFSGNSHPTPRYEYNQIMYEVDLGDPRLDLPRPVRGLAPWGECIGFHALPRPRRGSIAVYRKGDRLVLEPPATASQPIFHALPAGDSSPATRLLEEVEVNGRVEYRLVDRSDHAICRVWIHPLRVEIPLLEKGEPARVDPTTGRR